MELEPLLYDINQGGKILQMPQWTLRAQIKAGNIKIIRLGTRIMIHRAELARIAREGLPSLRIARLKCAESLDTTAPCLRKVCENPPRNRRVS